MPHSEDQLREQLFNLLQRSGIKNAVKAKLRADLINLVKHKPQNFLSETEIQSKTLLTKFSDQIILRHMKQNGYEYSASVFNSEAGIEKEKKIIASDYFVIKDKSHSDLLEKADIRAFH